MVGPAKMRISFGPPPATAAIASFFAAQGGQVLRFILRFRAAGQSGLVGAGTAQRPKPRGRVGKLDY